MKLHFLPLARVELRAATAYYKAINPELAVSFKNNALETRLLARTPRNLSNDALETDLQQRANSRQISGSQLVIGEVWQVGETYLVQ